MGKNQVGVSVVAFACNLVVFTEFKNEIIKCREYE